MSHLNKIRNISFNIRHLLKYKYSSKEDEKKKMYQNEKDPFLTFPPKVGRKRKRKRAESKEKKEKEKQKNLEAQSSHRTLEIISTNNPRNPGATATSFESRSLS